MAEKNKNYMWWIVIIMLIPICILCVMNSFVSKWTNGVSLSTKVMVINEDQPTMYQGKSVNAGNDLVRKLQKDHSLNWQFVDSQTGLESLKRNQSLIALTIPRNFSRNVTTVLSKKPKQATINVKLAESNTPISQAIFQTVMNSLRQQVSDTINKSYAESTLAGLSQLSDGTRQLDDGAHQLNNATNQLNSGAQELLSGQNTMFNELSLKIPSLLTGIDQLTEGQLEYFKFQNQMTQSHNKLSDGAHDIVNGINNAVSEIQQGQDNGANKLVNLEDGLDALTTGLTQLETDPLNKKLSVDGSGLEGGLKQAGNAATEMNKLLEQYTWAIELIGQGDQVDNLRHQLESGLESAAKNATNLKTDMTTLNTKLSQLSSGGIKVTRGSQTAINELTDNIEKIKVGMTGVEGEKTRELQKFASGMDSFQDHEEKLTEKNLELATGISKLNSTVGPQMSEQMSGQTSLVSGQKQLASGINSVHAQGTEKMVQQLDSKLSELPVKFNSRRSAKQFVSPVGVSTKSLSNNIRIKDFFAPAAMMVGLFIGAVVLEWKHRTTSTEWPDFKMILYASAIIPLGVILTLFVLHFQVDHWILLSFATSMIWIIFVLIARTLNKFLGKFGLAAGVLIAILQFIFSTQLLPVQLLGQFGSFVAWILPGTYATSMFATIMRGTGQINAFGSLIFLFGIGWLCTFFASRDTTFLLQRKN